MHCSPLPIPPPETPALLCVVAQGAPQAGGCRQDPSSQDYILPHPSLLGGGDQRDFQKRGKGDALGMKKTCGFVENSFLALLPL